MSDHAPDAIVFPPTKPDHSWIMRRISVKTILLVLAAVVLIVGTIATPVILAGLLCLCWPICAIAMLTAAISGRGWIRPFAIAALVPQIWFALALAAWPVHGLAETVVFLLIMYAISVIVGLVASITSCYLDRRSGLVPVPNIPFIRKWLNN
jgi:hypothetical protein